MFFRLRRDMAKRWFDFGVRAVRSTSPVQMDRRSAIHCVTQVYPPDLWMYLVAIKSFARRVPLARITVVADRLRERDRDVLRAHVEGIEIVDIDSVDTDGFPRGGCWERFLHILDVSHDAYVIQLDADTITLDVPRAVLDCVAAQRSFTLGTSMGRTVVSAREIARAMAKFEEGTKHIQVAAEAAFGSLDDTNARYIRGNAAFAGFARGAATREHARRFSDNMSRILGATKWSQWGSEQVASNFVVANTPDPVVLPFEDYRYFEPSMNPSTATFLHFIGSYRFHKGVYRALAREVIGSLR